ncbi:MAG: HAD family hydrolase [Ruminococcaceae bacterium]|nr:HAD family hydrolase [Oscillospiraceae bacterium]
MKKRKNILRQPLEVLEASPDMGLTEAQAQERKAKGWANGEAVSAGKTEWDIIAQNLFTFFNLVFIVMAVLLALAGSSIKNMTFMVVVICNLCIGIYQEIRAKRAVDKLKLVAAQRIAVIREGQRIILPSEELVRDDIVEFVVGDQICADGVLLTGTLQVNEALITGEEDAVTKAIGDRLLSGSFVISGKGRVRLTEVGADAFAAKLAQEAKKDPHAASSEMMTALDKLIRFVGIALIPVGALLFCQEFFRNHLDLTASAEKTVAALVGMIPEGLYLLTSVAMAVSSLKLTRDKVLVKDLNCIESLARVDVLCVDKTGTITEPGMEVEQIVPLTDGVDINAVFTAFYSNIEPENDTARALCERFSGTSDWVCQKRVPFTSETKQSAAVFEKQGAFITGAPEFVLGAGYAEIRDKVEFWSKKGSRVLLLAAAPHFPEKNGLQPVALAILSNRIRPAAKQTFAYFREQGVTVKVISGDNPLTVSQVALRAGIEGAENYVDTSTLNTPEEIAAAAIRCTVFGRVTPDKKKALLQALKKAGHTVAMTGDGVNDVLALKEADCSIAMASGAQAANQVAQLVLLNSDFAAMPAIVDEGRRVINNIQRAASLFLVKNILSLGLALVCLLTGQSYPFAPIHLTMISALTIGVPSFFLALEPNYERVSGRFLPTVLGRALPGGLTNLLLVLLVQLLLPLWGVGAGQIPTACVGILAVTGMAVLYRTCLPFDRFRRLLWWAMGIALVLCFTVLRGLFDLSYGRWQEMLMTLPFLVAAPLVFIALCKLFKPKKL